MNEQYPLPSYAAHIWIAGNDIFIQFPPCLAQDRVHTVKIPNTENGTLLLLDILRRRQSEVHLGLKGTPTQYEVERTLAGDRKYAEWLKELKRTRDVSAQEKAESEAFLKELGL